MTKAICDDRMRQLQREGEADGGAEGFRSERQQAYADAFADAMTGRGGFWDSVATDYSVQAADKLQHACALIGLTPAQRWHYLEGCLSALAHEYAFTVADNA